MHSAVRNVMRLFDRIKDFEKKASHGGAREPEALLQALPSSADAHPVRAAPGEDCSLQMARARSRRAGRPSPRSSGQSVPDAGI